MRYFLQFFLAVILSLFAQTAAAQKDTTTASSKTLVRVVKTDGGELLGYILEEDAREILFNTRDGRTIYIPQHTIEEIEIVKAHEIAADGTFLGEEVFATRYFLTTNGLPLKKGQHYIQWNLYGPDFQFSLPNDIGVGLMTTWVGVPVIANVKKSIKLGEKTQLAAGALLGTGSWAEPDFSLALPFATLSFGDRTKNIAFSGGYGAIFSDGQSSSRFLCSVAGMAKITPKLSFIFDSFILPGSSTSGENDGFSSFALIIPGLRWYTRDDGAFQFGFTGIMEGGEAVPVAIPMIQWFTTL
jgi:hypothetical protein